MRSRETHFKSNLSPLWGKTHKPGGYNTTYLLSELQSYLRGKGSKPSIEVELCFGEEFPDPKLPKNRKLIVAQVGAKEGGVAESGYPSEGGKPRLENSY